jgi:hypothetical protein
MAENSSRPTPQVVKLELGGAEPPPVSSTAKYYPARRTRLFLQEKRPEWAQILTQR